MAIQISRRKLLQSLFAGAIGTGIAGVGTIDAPDEAEDNEEMNDAEPKDIAQVYAELQSRLDRLTAALERKRAAEFSERRGGEMELGGESG